MIDLAECTRCEGCIALCPSVFRVNQAGFLEAVERPEYPEEEVDEAIKNCPARCIRWEQE
ncbi:MAG: ferredoxin [Desulfobacterales bacterium]